ncbi:MAG: DNA polymerase III subunit chi [Ferrovum sp.]|nr:DNA polymerase III subunit chi [Ferrovum sp.]NDU87124.1 DNA polymerase III subunit chi [Ferrovum sp.]
MTRIDFYTHVNDKVPVAVQLTCKAWAQGLSVWLRVPDEAVAGHLDQLLWTHPKAEFVPHCRSDHPLVAETPIVIDAHDHEPRSHQLLINLRGDQPAYFARFARLAEIVTLEESDAQNARERFKFYRHRGFEVATHNLSHHRF